MPESGRDGDYACTTGRRGARLTKGPGCCTLLCVLRAHFPGTAPGQLVTDYGKDARLQVSRPSRTGDCGWKTCPWPCRAFLELTEVQDTSAHLSFPPSCIRVRLAGAGLPLPASPCLSLTLLGLFSSAFRCFPSKTLVFWVLSWCVLPTPQGSVGSLVMGSLRFRSPRSPERIWARTRIPDHVCYISFNNPTAWQCFSASLES